MSFLPPVRLRMRFLAALILAAFFVGALARPALALDVRDLRVGIHPDKTRMVFDLSEKSSFRTFVLSDPWRLVVDLPDYKWGVGNIARPSASGITAIRQGALQPGVSRIVIDMNRPVTIKSAFFLPQDKGLPDRLVIDFAKASPEGALAQKNKIFGTLNPGTEPSATPVAGATKPTQKPALDEPVQDIALASPKAEKASPHAPSVAPPRKPETTESGATPPVPAPRSSSQKPLIVLDSGHGGIDPGALGAGGLFEKNITLEMAKELKKQLEATGRYRVALTRDKDTYLRLSQRVAYARKQGADLFVSLHADSIKNPGVRGASVYTLSEKASDEQTAKLAETENQADLIAGVDLSHEDEDVTSILVDLSMRDTMNQSKFFANTLVSALDDSQVNTLENPHRSAGFAVLKAPDIPSVLIELGFMSSKKDVAILRDPAQRRAIAVALTDGINSYFDRLNHGNRI